MRIQLIVKGKGKGSPLQAQAASWGFRRLRLPDLIDIRHYEGGKVVTLTHRPPSPPGVFLVLILEAESTPGHMELSEPRKKSPAKPPGIDPKTLRLEAQCLNHYATPGPIQLIVVILKQEDSTYSSYHNDNTLKWTLLQICVCRFA